MVEDRLGHMQSHHDVGDGMKEHEVQRASRRRIREDRRGDPHWTDEGDGYFALHIQYGGNAVVIHVGAGSEDQAAFREWLEYLDAARAKSDESDEPDG